jgi:hypothetical protein
MKLHFVSCDIAFANKVLPHPLEPYNKTPFDKSSPRKEIVWKTLKKI